jgi:hypothetical protein
MNRVLVTGGAGFIGNNLVRRLYSEGYNVDVVDNMQSGDLNKLVGLPFRVIPALGQLLFLKAILLTLSFFPGFAMDFMIMFFILRQILVLSTLYKIRF